MRVKVIQKLLRVPQLYVAQPYGNRVTEVHELRENMDVDIEALDIQYDWSLL